MSLPPQFYLYCCLPLLLWWTVLRRCLTVTTLPNFRPLYIVGSVALYLILLELLVMTFFTRWFLSFVVGSVGLWPLFLQERRKLLPASLKIYWLVLFLILAAFPALPCVGHQTHIELVALCGALWLVLGLASLYFVRTQERSWTIPGQIVLQLMTLAVVMATARDFDSGLGLRVINQLAAWLLLVTSVAVPLLTDNQVSTRFLSIGLGLAVPFLLLCVGHEAFFLLTLFLSLCTWIVVEARLSQVQISKIKFEENLTLPHTLTADHFRRCFFFLMFLILSFFGTGNIASVNSFDVSWVRCFLTVFSPFTMMTLILLKTLVPFLLVTCAFRAVNILSQMKAVNMFIIVLIYCDIMGLHFLFAVTNKGSWLEIGTSVSHFVIMEVTVLFIAVLYYISRLYTSTVLFKQTHKAPPIVPIWIPMHKKHPD